MGAPNNNNNKNAWFPSVLGAATSIGGTLLNQAFAEKNRERNFYYNEQAAKNADMRTRMLYNDLYSPAAQMKQLREAGLSPSLMYQNGGGNAGASGAQSAGLQGPYPSAQSLDPLTFAQIANINADTKVKENQAENIGTDTELKGQQIINIIADTNNKNVTNRILSAEADLAELEFATDLQTAQATIRMAYANAEKAANEARSAAVKADLDEATFDCAYQLAYANLDQTLTDTALMKSEIGVNKAQIKEIAERIRNSQWQTWATEKEQNRKDAIFELDKARLHAECKKWAAEINVRLTEAQLEMVSDLVGYVCNFATAGLSNATQIKQTEMYNTTKKEIAEMNNRPRTRNKSTDHYDAKGNHKGHTYTTEIIN